MIPLTLTLSHPGLSLPTSLSLTLSIYAERTFWRAIQGKRRETEGKRKAFSPPLMTISWVFRASQEGPPLSDINVGNDKPGWERARVRGIKDGFLENPGFSGDRITRRLQITGRSDGVLNRSW